MNCIIVSTFSLLMLFVWISQINLAVAMIDGVVEKYLNYIRLADDELARDPSSVGAMSDKAWALYNLGNYENKRSGFNVYMDNSLAFNNSTSSATVLYQEALKYFGKILKIDPNAEFNKNNLSTIKFKNNTVNAQNEYDGHSLVGIGVTLVALGKHEEALKYFNYYIDVYGDDDSDGFFANVKKGMALANLGRYEEAIKHYDWILKHYSSYSESRIHNNKGVALANLGKYEDAIETYDEGLRSIDDKYHDILIHNKGVALANLGKYEDAIKNYDKILDSQSSGKSTAMITFNDKGAALSKLGRYDEAINNYDMALSINRNFKDALYNKAVTLGKMGEPEKAIQLYDKVLELDPSNADALNNKFIELSKVSPNFSPINGNDEIFKGHYVYVSSTAGEPISISIQKLKIQVEKQHDNYKLIFKLGEKLENMSKFTEAINYYNKSLAVNPKYVPALNHIGYLMNKMCEKMCNPPPGKSYLDKASQLSNSTSQIDINLTEKDVNLGTSYAIVATSNEQSPF